MVHLLNNVLQRGDIYAILAIFLAIYGPRLHPRLPSNIRSLFNTTWFRLLIILLIVFLSSHDLKLSLLVSLAFLLILMMVDATDIKEHFKTQMDKNKKNKKNTKNTKSIKNTKVLKK